MIFTLSLMTDILSIMNVLSLVLQKEGKMLDDVQHAVSIALKDFRKLAATGPSQFSHVMSPEVSYYAQCERCEGIVEEFCSTKTSLQSNQRKFDLSCYHSIIAIPLRNVLIDEVKCAFDTTSVLNLDSFSIIHPANILTDVSSEYGIESFQLIYSLHKKMMSMMAKEQKEKLIRCGKDTFISKCASYAKFVAVKKIA